MKKILFIIILLAAAYGGYWLWNNRYDYFFNGNMETQEEDDSQTETQKTEGDTNLPDAEDDVDTSTAPEGAKITDYDCSQRCEHRKNTSSYNYCREICGLNESLPPEDDGKIDISKCDQAEGINQDICFKRKAVEEKNDNVCDSIKDQQLKENCINRVAEEILE